MDLSRLHRISNWEWRFDPEGEMRVPAVLYGDEGLIAEMDDKVLEQIGNAACLPGIVDAAYTMPDAHWGYGFPIGGVAAFDADAGGVLSAGGVGFDISCGVRTLLTGLKRPDLEPCKEALAHSLSRTIPAGIGSTGITSTPSPGKWVKWGWFSNSFAAASWLSALTTMKAPKALLVSMMPVAVTCLVLPSGPPMVAISR